MYKLTAQGTQLANKTYSPGKDPELSILVYIQDQREPVTIDELCGYFHSTENTMERILNRLTNQRLVEETTQREE